LFFLKILSRANVNAAFVKNESIKFAAKTDSATKPNVRCFVLILNLIIYSNNMPKLIFLFFVALCLSCGQNDASAQAKLSPDQFEAMLKSDAGIQIVDVRTPDEFKSGYIAGAKNINYYDDDFAQQIARLDKTKPVAVYCAKGGRSASAAEEFTKAGFPKVFDLQGGMSAWKAAGKKTQQ
jgi:rhodanese-related sulfurtransferase